MTEKTDNPVAAGLAQKGLTGGVRAKQGRAARVPGQGFSCILVPLPGDPSNSQSVAMGDLNGDGALTWSSATSANPAGST